MKWGWNIRVYASQSIPMFNVSYNYSCKWTKWPEMNKLDFQTCSRSLRSIRELRTKPSVIPHMFQDASANSFNALHSSIKTETSQWCAETPSLGGRGAFWPVDQLLLLVKKGHRKYCGQLCCSLADFWPTFLWICKYGGRPPYLHITDTSSFAKIL